MNAKKRIRVMLVDDHTVMRDGLALLLSTYEDLKVVAQASSGEEALAFCEQVQPEVVIMDLSLPEMDGPTTIGRLRARYPEMTFIALTSFLDEKLIKRALQAGAIGYLLKSVHADHLANAIRAAVEGELTLDPAAAQLLVRSVTQPQPAGYDLTSREREVLALVAEGKTNRQIADSLSLSYGTVRVYVSNLLAKLGASNRTEAVSLALQHDLLPDKS